MTLKEQVQDIMKTAMKAGDKDKTTFARNLFAAIRKVEVDTRVDLDDAGIQKIILGNAKQRRESIEQFKAGNREDLVAKEEAELNFLTSFLPKQLSTEELRALVQQCITESGAAGPNDMGKVMKVLQPKILGKADGKVASQVVRELLAK